MGDQPTLPTARDALLFTPGPLTTSRTVKQAMLRDLGSRDDAFVAIVREIRERLVALGDASTNEYTAILVQGSGTSSLEAVVSSVIPPDGKLLVLINGAYGRRMARIAEIHHIPVVALSTAEDTPPAPLAVDAMLAADPAISHVAVVHLETTTGILNPIKDIGAVVKRHERAYIVDAMSSFGAIPLSLCDNGIDYMVSSANKCIEGVPGFSHVLARIEALQGTVGYARTLTLDLLDQWRGLESNGQFRFTPPTHALLAFHQALVELDAEGGIAARAERYAANHCVLMAGMRALGFREYLAPEHQSDIITSFYYPDHPAFSFAEFYRRLNDKGYVIYPGKLSGADCFRIGSIGRITTADVRALLAAMRETLIEMGIAGEL